MSAYQSQIDSEIHSEEVNEIIGQTPHFLARYGTLIFFAIILLFLATTWIIKYPDSVSGACTLYAKTSPKSVISKSSGRIASLFVSDGDTVKFHQPLLLIETIASYPEVEKLESTLSELWEYVRNEEWEKIAISPADFRNIGELQGIFQSFFTAYTRLNSFVARRQYSNRKMLLQKDQRNNDSLARILQNQKKIYEKDYAIAEGDYKAKQSLFEDKVIARSELKQEESKLLSKKLPLENIDVSLINNRSQAMAREKELLELDKQYFEVISEFTQSINNLSSEIKTWKLRYLLLAPTNGTVVFTETVQESQEVTAGKELFFVEPVEKGCYAQVLVDQTNFGKVQIGQHVVIRLPSYPFQEYGELEGKVESISRIPSKERQYIIKVSLINELITNHGRQIHFLNELIADAEIITEKKRLLHKFLYSIRGIFQKRT